METNKAVEALHALAHDTRLNVFRKLVKAGPEGVPAGVLAAETGVVANTMSAHLAVLSKAGLIFAERRGRSIVYRAAYDEMAALMSFLLADCCGGAVEVCAPLDALLRRSAACGRSAEPVR